MIYVKLRSVDLPFTVTNKRSNVAKKVVDDLVKKKVNGEKFHCWKLVTDTKRMIRDTSVDKVW